jgi:hypothetical protein
MALDASPIQGDLGEGVVPPPHRVRSAGSLGATKDCGGRCRTAVLRLTVILIG